jgi:hypothetical protein
MWLCTFAGIVRRRWTDRHRPIAFARPPQAPGAATTVRAALP